MMKPRASFLPYFSFFCALALSGVQVASANNATTPSKFAGEYASRGYEGGKSGPSLDLSLGRDGTATVTEDYGKGFETLFGHWTEAGNQITISFDATEGEAKEPSMVFQPAHDGLQAITWNRAEWGKEEPPPMKKGAYKIKQTYWFTMNP